MVLAVVAGLVIVLARLYGVAPLRWLAQAYVEVDARHAAADPAFSYLLRPAANRHPAQRLSGGDSRAWA